ncbi:MAG: hypothetical protein QOH60_681 [Mycobacterium sp.]|nr:hypothetical protein [Mycobacterium sp.]
MSTSVQFHFRDLPDPLEAISQRVARQSVRSAARHPDGDRATGIAPGLGEGVVAIAEPSDADSNFAAGKVTTFLGMQWDPGCVGRPVVRWLRNQDDVSVAAAQQARHA